MPGLQLFSKMLPKKVSFSKGETPSHTKMNGIFDQLSNAFFMLESFLGNGPDYRIDEDKDRKMLFNLSSAMGCTDKLYKPINRIASLKRIQKKYGVATTTYDSVNDILNVVSYDFNTTIPVDSYAGEYFGVYYTGRGILTGIDGNPASQIILPDMGTGWGWYYYTTPTDLSWFKIKKYNNNANPFKIKSMFLAPKIDGHAFNKAYSIPIDNAAYWTVKTPCKYAKTGAVSSCYVKTCEYCIGNTYGIDSQDTATYGKPVCSGAYHLNGVTEEPITYEADTTTPRKDYLTVASPVLTKSNNFAVKFRPFSMHDLAVDTDVPQNFCLVYDTQNSASPLSYTTILTSAGRGDIFYVKDKSSLINGIGDSKRYIVLGGDYGLTNLMNDLLQNIELPIPIDSIEPDVAIYSEEA